MATYHCLSMRGRRDVTQHKPPASRPSAGVSASFVLGLAAAAALILALVLAAPRKAYTTFDSLDHSSFFVAIAAIWLAVQTARTARKQVQTLAETVADGYWEADAGLRVTWLSERVLTRLGLPWADITGPMPWHLPPPTCQRDVAPWPPRDGKGAIDTTVVVDGTDGRHRVLRFTGQSVSFANGRVCGYRGTVADITAARPPTPTAPDDALPSTSHDAARLAVALQTMPNGIVMFGDDLHVTVYNQRFLDMWQLTEAELARMPRMPDLIRFLAERGDYGPGDPADLAAQRQAVMLRDALSTNEITRPNGRVLEVQCHGRSETGYVLTYLDITERRRAEMAVQDNERQLREILDHSPVGLTIASADGRTRRFWNRRLSEMHGFGPHEDMTHHFVAESFAATEDHVRITEAIVGRGAPVRMEMPRRRRDGTTWWCLVDIAPIRYFGQPSVCLWHYDISDRRRIEEERDANRRLLRATIDAIPAIVNVKDRSLRYVFMNTYQAELLGVTSADVVGRDPMDLVGHEHSRRWLDKDVEVLRTGKGLDFFEDENIFADGKRRWLLATKQPLFDDAGCLTHTLTVALDITHQKLTELALRESDIRLKLALRITRAGIWSQDLATGQRGWSSEFSNIFGIDEDDLSAQGRSFRDLIHPADRPDMEEMLNRHLRGENSEYRTEYRMRHGNGTWLWCHDVGRVLRDHYGNATHFVGILVDVTERRRTERDLIRAEQMAALGRLVAGVAHEINTPVGLGVGVASHLDDCTRRMQALYDAENVTQGDFEDYLGTAADSTATLLANLQRAAELVRSFKQLAVDQTSERKRLFNLFGYIQEILISLRPKLKRTDHTVAVSCPTDLEIDSFPGALSQILTNLIDNSLIHGFDGRNGGRIDITATMETDMLVLGYKDNGRGLAPDAVDRVYEPFYTTRRGQGGSGLGMHIVYSLVTKTLGGRITCESEPDQGVHIRIAFPCRHEGRP